MSDFIRLRDSNLSEINSVVKVTGMIKDIIERKTIKQDTYLDLVLADNRRQISCKYFNVDKINIVLQVGDVIEAVIKVSEYNGQPSYLILESRVTNYSPSDYITWFEKLPQLKVEFDKLRGLINCEIYSTVLNELITKVEEQFLSVPAAKSMHHTEFGGCLAHSTLVAMNCLQVSKLYNSVYSIDKPFIDIELVVTGALIHDMAKVVELDWCSFTGSVGYSSDISCLDSHITKLSEWLTLIANKHGFLDEEKYRLLRHCILAHHGKLEWGSPVVPSVPEAYVISMCDKLDADVWGYFNSLNDIESEQSEYCRVGGEFKRVYKKS